MKEITDDNFVEETANGIVLLDFWATWCGPCKVLMPILQQIDDEYDNVTVCKADADNGNFANMEKFGITAIPSLVFMKDGEFIKMVTGLQPKSAITEALDTLLNM